MQETDTDSYLHYRDITLGAARRTDGRGVAWGWGPGARGASVMVQAKEDVDLDYGQDTGNGKKRIECGDIYDKTV